MPQAKKLVTAGISGTAANATVGDVGNTLTATGATQATALALPNDVNRFTTVAAGTGTILPAMNPGDSVIIRNGGANALLVYPPVGGLINALATNAGYSVATATPFCKIVCVDALTYIAMQAA
jgi:hypothetical protein